MAFPPWTVELIRRGLTDVARRASEPEALDKLKSQANEILQELPQTAARGIDAVMRTAEAGKKSIERWSRKHTALAVPALNATGILTIDHSTLAGTSASSVMPAFGNLGVPLSAEAVEVGRELLSGDAVPGPGIDSRLQRTIPGGAGDIAIASSFSAALSALSLLVQHRQLVVHRKHSVRLPGGTPLPEAFGTLVPVITEVGSIDRVEPSDFEGLGAFCAIMADDGQQPVELISLGGRDAMQAVVLPIATFESSTHDDLPSAQGLLEAGADIVVMPGNGLCGGPESGILVGPKSVIDEITRSAVWPSLSASDAIRAMLLVTLEATAASGHDVPIRTLLETGEPNLQDRARRMATRLGGCDSIQSSRVGERPARIAPHGRWELPSRQICLRHHSLETGGWLEELRETLPAVFASQDGDELIIDLRWIPAAEDGRLAETLERQPS